MVCKISPRCCETHVRNIFPRDCNVKTCVRCVSTGRARQRDQIVWFVQFMDTKSFLRALGASYYALSNMRVHMACKEVLEQGGHCLSPYPEMFVADDDDDPPTTSAGEWDVDRNAEDGSELEPNSRYSGISAYDSEDPSASVRGGEDTNGVLLPHCSIPEGSDQRQDWHDNTSSADEKDDCVETREISGEPESGWKTQPLAKDVQPSSSVRGAAAVACRGRTGSLERKLTLAELKHGTTKLSTKRCVSSERLGVADKAAAGASEQKREGHRQAARADPSKRPKSHLSQTAPLVAVARTLHTTGSTLQHPPTATTLSAGIARVPTRSSPGATKAPAATAYNSLPAGALANSESVDAACAQAGKEFAATVVAATRLFTEPVAGVHAYDGHSAAASTPDTTPVATAQRQNADDEVLYVAGAKEEKLDIPVVNLVEDDLPSAPPARRRLTSTLLQSGALGLGAGRPGTRWRLEVRSGSGIQVASGPDPHSFTLSGDVGEYRIFLEEEE